MKRCQEDFGKTRYGHVWGQISLKVDFSFQNCYTAKIKLISLVSPEIYPKN